MTCPYRYTDGAYVLAALSPGERAEFEQHVVACESCTAGVRELAPLPGLLGRVDPLVAEQGLPSSSRLPRLLETVAASRRRQVRLRRWRLAAVAATAAATAAVGVTYWPGLPDLAGPPVATAPMAEMRSVVEDNPVTAEVRLIDRAGGTEVAMRCEYGTDYVGEPWTFRLVAVGADGTHEQLGSWRAGPGDRVELTGVTHFTGRDLRRIELRDQAGTTLLVHQP